MVHGPEDRRPGGRGDTARIGDGTQPDQDGTIELAKRHRPTAAPYPTRASVHAVTGWPAQHMTSVCRLVGLD